MSVQKAAYYVTHYYYEFCMQKPEACAIESPGCSIKHKNKTSVLMTLQIVYLRPHFLPFIAFASTVYISHPLEIIIHHFQCRWMLQWSDVMHAIACFITLGPNLHETTLQDSLLPTIFCLLVCCYWVKSCTV